MFLRTVSRAVPRSTAAIRVAPASVNAIQTRAASDHAIANPTLASIEKRWEGMPPQEQAELWMQLRDRMKVDWHQLTQQEKKAGTCCLQMSGFGRDSLSLRLPHRFRGYTRNPRTMTPQSISPL